MLSLNWNIKDTIIRIDMKHNQQESRKEAPPWNGLQEFLIVVIPYVQF